MCRQLHYNSYSYQSISCCMNSHTTSSLTSEMQARERMRAQTRVRMRVGMDRRRSPPKLQCCSPDYVAGKVHPVPQERVSLPQALVFPLGLEGIHTQSRKPRFPSASLYTGFIIYFLSPVVATCNKDPMDLPALQNSHRLLLSCVAACDRHQFLIT